MAITSKDKAVGIIHECAVLYNKNLSGKNVLYVTEHRNKPAYFETLFLPQNFLHLTGMKTKLNSDHFLRAALNKRLSPSDIEFDAGGTTELKLDILPRLMQIHTTARMIGDYDNTRPLLATDKFAGTITMAVGFINIGNIYIPNTTLKIDVRSITTHATRRKIIATFTKPRNEAYYSHMTYISKGTTVDDEILHSILHRVDMKNLTAVFSIPRK